MNILLVEDHADSRRTLQRLIAQRGHEVVAVSSAEEAEAALATRIFPFVLLDWMLPGKSGLELCRQVRAQPDGDEMFILLVTARADTADLAQALAAGANDYLTKPIDLALLNVRLSVAERQVRELTERNHARRALRESARAMTNILENTADGFFALDRSWKFTYVNPAAEILLERPRADLEGKVFWEELPEAIGSIFEARCREVMEEQTSVEFEVPSSNGKRIREVKAYPSDAGISVFIRDITERKRVEIERFTKSKLESLGTLAGGIAHDLNNILTVISGNVGLALNATPQSAGNWRSALARAAAATQHATQLSRKLLTFSKGGAPRKKSVPILPLLSEATELALHGSNLRADLQLPDDLWESEMDEGQIEQVLSALILNAREVMPRGGKIRVMARNMDFPEGTIVPVSGGRYVKVAITNEGAGVSEEVASRMFDPYFTTKESGSGLGLSISYSIIKKHGGLLHLESTSAEGSTLAFYLPATGADAALLKTVENKNSTAPSPRRVLIMDDEPAIRDLTSQLLAMLDCEVLAVGDGAEALEQYEEGLRIGKRFHAVILDATVRGGMGGVETVRRLRLMDPAVNAIICSGYSDEAALANFRTHGFRGVLPKPFSLNELEAALEGDAPSSAGAVVGNSIPALA
ncbi:MAG: response regulator [Verrucomicrobiota bacterium]|nr:response regulator [Verrucomicrobiota bacterium]